jgi:VanZ family protein
MSDSRRYLFRTLTVGWMMLIFFLSSQTSLQTPPLFPGADLLAHAVFYAVLGVFLARSLIPQRVMTWRRIMLLTILVTAYGITDEYHQSFVPGRDASGWDILADGLGGFLAAWMLFWWDRRAVNISQPVLPNKEKRIPRAMAHPSSMGEDGG